MSSAWFKTPHNTISIHFRALRTLAKKCDMERDISVTGVTAGRPAGRDASKWRIYQGATFGPYNRDPYYRDPYYRDPY